MKKTLMKTSCKIAAIIICILAVFGIFAIPLYIDYAKDVYREFENTDLKTTFVYFDLSDSRIRIDGFPFSGEEKSHYVNYRGGGSKSFIC